MSSPCKVSCRRSWPEGNAVVGGRCWLVPFSCGLEGSYTGTFRCLPAAGRWSASGRSSRSAPAATLGNSEPAVRPSSRVTDDAVMCRSVCRMPWPLAVSKLPAAQSAAAFCWHHDCLQESQEGGTLAYLGRQRHGGVTPKRDGWRSLKAPPPCPPGLQQQLSNMSAGVSAVRACTEASVVLMEPPRNTLRVGC